MNTAAIYLRSSKDRHEISLDAQRRELSELAKSKGLVIVETFQDAVESGKDDQRPGFQALLRSLKDPARTWNHLLALDTSRIARNQYLAHAFHYESEKRNIKIIYAKVPETGGVMDVVIRAVMQAFDQLHSLMSREKGLSGMAENVKQGWRAGGRAPYGYQLKYIPTGAVRDGSPVTKSQLEPNSDSSKVSRYLKERAGGISRKVAAANAGMRQSDSSLIGIEWNALTYAGHTVWNVHAERISGGGYKGGTKRRPRSDWVIHYDSHPALISTEEAEVIVSRLDLGRPTKYRTPADYLLSGLLFSPDGRAWYGEGANTYRLGKGKRINQQQIEEAVVDQVAKDLASDRFVEDLAREVKKLCQRQPDERVKPLQIKIKALTAKADKLASIAAESESPRPFLEQINVIEKERSTLLNELETLERESRSSELLKDISTRDVKALLTGLAEHLQQVDKAAIKELMAGIIDRIMLDPEFLAAEIRYGISAGKFLASPRGFEPRFIP